MADEKRILEPAVLGRENMMGLFGLGGIVDKGKMHAAPVIGADIQFNGANVFGVDAFRYMNITTGGLDGKVGTWIKDSLTPAVNKISTELEKLMKYTVDKEKGTTEVSVNSSQKLSLLLGEIGYTNILKNVYESFPSITGDSDERTAICWFAGTRAAKATGIAGAIEVKTKDAKTAADILVTDDLFYQITLPNTSQKTKSFIRQNMGTWTAMEVAMGVRQKATPMDWLDFFAKYGKLERISVDNVLQVLDSVSWRPLVSGLQSPFLYMAKQLMRLGIYIQTCQTLTVENWCFPTSSLLVAANNPEANLGLVTGPHMEGWTRGSFRLARTNSGKFPLRVLPFTLPDKADNKEAEWKYKFDSFDVPVLSLAEIAIDDKDVTNAIKFEDPILLNDEKKDGSYLWDRSMYQLIGDLTDESTVPRISSVLPRYLNRERPDTVYAKLPRDQWKLSFLIRSGLDSFTEILKNYSAKDNQKTRTIDAMPDMAVMFTGVESLFGNSFGFIPNIDSWCEVGKTELSLGSGQNVAKVPIKLF